MTRTCATILAGMAIIVTLTPPARAASANDILKTAGVTGGLIVHVGCGDGKLTAALRAADNLLVHGLDTDARNVAAARKHVAARGLYGKVSVDTFDGARLPYVDNLVNLVVSDDLGSVPMAEVMRVLAPNGVALIGGTKTVKPRPKEIDEWTHFLHSPTNNAVARDTVAGPPRRMQGGSGPRYSRHHDRMTSLSAAVTAGGRVFTIFDEATPTSILAAPRWTVVARDAFNGVVLWKREMGKWHTHLWPLKSGPAQLPRRLIASGDRVYVTLSIDGPVVALDAATGKTVRTYEQTKVAEEMLLSDGVLFALVNTAEYTPPRGGYGSKFWDEAERQIVAVKADTGKTLWSVKTKVLPMTLAADSGRVVLHDGQCVVSLDRKTGKQAWRSDPIARAKEIKAFYGPILVLYEDVVLFSGGETAGMQTGSWYTKGKDTMTALSGKTGKVLWSAYHPPSGYRSSEDLLVVDGLVWTGETTSGRAVGVFTGRDPRTGKVVRQFPPDVEIYWFHHRCYRGKATDRYLLMARTGTEFIDVRNKTWDVNHWVRGACGYGVLPANGLLYAPQHPCACYLEAKLSGFNALAPASKVEGRRSKVPRLDKGPAYGTINLKSKIYNRKSNDWPTYRHDNARTGKSTTKVPAQLKPAWSTGVLGKKLSAPVMAAGMVFVASIDDHTVCAVDAETGKLRWRFRAGGRVDSPPTIHNGHAFFGSADGWVYSVRVADGELAWRFRAAPMDQRTVSFGQVESVWPVHGSELIRDDVLYCVAGRSMFLDTGLRLWRLRPATGAVLSCTVLDEKDTEAGKSLQDYVSWLNMPVGLPDVLSADEKFVYMRSQPFGFDGKRLPLKPFPRGKDADQGAPPPTQTKEYTHLFSPTGFLDDTWWHRTYWMWGSMFVSGWQGYYRSGTAAPAGRILVVDDQQIYGFGRKPKYYRWTTPIEHHLFAAAKSPDAAPSSVPRKPTRTPKRSLIQIAKSKALNTAGKPVTVAAWVKSDKPDGVILARGGTGMGYVLYLQGGRARFAIRLNGKIHAAAAKAKVVGKWTHVAGVLTAEGKVLVHVDGKPAGSGKAPGLITGDPQEGMEIGMDDESSVGGYNSTLPLTGLIDEVRVYRRALGAAEIAAAAGGKAAGKDAHLVLACSFDDGKASDASGRGNHGKVVGARAVAGKVGKAMRFFGGTGGSSPAVKGFKVKHNWTVDLPLMARAMVVADKTLFLAGPADLVDEEQAYRKMNDAETQKALAAQVEAMEGKRGAVLWAVSTEDGTKLAELALPAPPVFDGLIATAGRLVIATTDGKIVCLGGG